MESWTVVRKTKPSKLLILGAIMATADGVAGNQIVDGTMIDVVLINGGADTTNPGTSCLKISAAVSQACPSGVIAIGNNNKQLLAAALQAKASASPVWFYYDDGAGSFHCPGWAYTPCSVVSIAIR